ncbi:asparagine synthase-related protein [Halocatena halophila]|uniref:asparagine synthase-related protein n=1 Tax=Halocatena halophila TaxID=2814576 RepID=UPI002ED4EB09
MKSEFHACIDHQERTTEPCFREYWIKDRLKRESIREGNVSLHVDKYEHLPILHELYVTDNELLIAFSGELHDISHDFHRQSEISFTTRTTYDILAVAYRTFGWSFPKHLIGDYHVLIADYSQDRLLAGRDHVTADPLYFAVKDGATLVSTDLSALANEIQADVNETYLGQYLTGTIESPRKTFYDNIYRVPPGCVVVSSPDTTQVRRYYHPHPDNRTTYRSKSTEELAETLRELLEDAIDCRTIQTETVGVFMSGGADSTALATIANDQASSSSLKTYSYTYPSTTAINENQGIEAVVSEKGLHNEQISVDDYWVLKDKTLYERAWAYAPAVDSLLQPKHELIQRAAADGVGTVLVGDNGNMLDGYRISIADAFATGQYLDAIKTAQEDPTYTTLACLVQYGLFPLLSIGEVEYLPPRQVQSPVRDRLSDHIRTQVEDIRRSPRRCKSLQAHSDQALYRALTSPIFDYRYDIFRKIAKYHGVNVIDPYQDLRLVEFVFDLPLTANLQRGYNKAIFRRALSDVLPKQILTRRKTDRVEEEVADGLRQEIEYLGSLLSESYLTDYGIVSDRRSIPDLHQAIDAFGSLETADVDLWQHISAQAWLEQRQSK